VFTKPGASSAIFIDPNMTGHNWKKIGTYEALLPWVAHRSDLNYIIGENDR